jgi:hypothetical protein
MSNPRAAQKCKYCDHPAAKALIWAEGRAYIPVCRGHESKARSVIREQGDGVDDVVKCSQRPLAYRESADFRMQSALQPPPIYEHDDMENSYGQRVGGVRAASLMQEAPKKTPMRVAPIGRASAPRGATIRTRADKSKDVMKISDKPIKRLGGRSKEIRKRTTGPIGYIGKKEIPDSVLQMLGTDWKRLTATRSSDNRISVNIDGVKFTVSTKRG